MIDRFTGLLPTPEEYELFREAYAETYPVRPLLNAVDVFRAALQQIADNGHWSSEAMRDVAHRALRPDLYPRTRGQ